ncbi:MAG: LPS assembly lipoprotein LptE, partial [Burkholderiales bacterium]
MKPWLAILCVAALAGCGFQLRAAAKLPFDTVYVAAADGGIALELKRNIRAGTDAKVVDDAKKAEAL